jgi:hypothetical protein
VGAARAAQGSQVTVSVVVPWSPGCPHRERAWAFVRDRYDLEVIEGSSPPGPYNRAAAILDGAAKATGDLLVIADADVFLAGPLDESIAHTEQAGWAVPHRLIHRLSRTSTEQVYAGADWHGLPLSDDNRQDSKPYQGNETGTLLVIRRDVLEQAPPDPRFVGWGQEDNAWGYALRCLIGPPWRGTADLVHLWHPPQPRTSRVTGNPENRALLNRYRQARRSPKRMAELIREAA